MRRTLLVILVVAMAGACLPAAAGDYLEKVDEPKFGQPTEKEALVYFVRTTSFGFAIKFWAFAEQTFLGVTQGKSYTFALVPEGKHLFWSKAENIATLEMEVLGGKTYYLRQEVRMGGFRARTRLSIMDEADAKEAFKKCKYVMPTDEGRQKAQELAKEHWAKAQLREDQKEKWEEGKDSESSAKD